MKKLILFFLIAIISCNKESKISAQQDEKNLYPFGFIEPKTNIEINLNLKTNNIIEVLTSYKLSLPYDRCIDDKGIKCKGLVNVSTHFFFNFTNTSRDLIVQNKTDTNCECLVEFFIENELLTIPLNKISKIDTFSIVNNYNKSKLTSLIINPKYNSESIDYRNIRRYLDSKTKKFKYLKDSGKTKAPIIIYAPPNLAIYLKKYLEDLVELNK
ncbi:hypothetical protein Q73A0000_01405 [Kaistella flava (ex Peng et al. 2021)]|uniref:Lipoprotein n=1 Tax=Kaistella flava (ex Peng et al. 2021) TaxID=2038776 RepID=A0A7M2Y5H1_9FLAO|nr:hypothetical protein [Kaistella flava (ex Peng et al. 2021)]QOW09099.1 hypothetical protein Q73A0000_01405 [Kaistella flava (ex Peng et al. 2021)]